VKHPILCGMLVLATGGGVAFVVANRPTPVTVPDTPLAAATESPTTADPCPQCRTGSAGVTDVTDLSARFAAKSEARGEFVSFDEPPLAKPKGELMPVTHETTDPREVLPPPREVK
jgi:hypothetical protein